MRVERIIPGEYRVQLDHMVGGYVWIFREGKGRWSWTIGGYGSYNQWLTDTYGPFPTLRAALKDVVRSYS